MTGIVSVIDGMVLALVAACIGIVSLASVAAAGILLTINAFTKGKQWKS